MLSRYRNGAIMALATLVAMGQELSHDGTIAPPQSETASVETEKQ